jgi:hypothetical protein
MDDARACACVFIMCLGRAVENFKKKKIIFRRVGRAEGRAVKIVASARSKPPSRADLGGSSKYSNETLEHRSG